MGPVQWIQLKYYQYKLTSALYMLEPWEQALFNTFVITVLTMAIYTTYTFGPANFYWFLASLLDYFPALDTVVPSFRLSSLLPTPVAAARAAGGAS